MEHEELEAQLKPTSLDLVVLTCLVIAYLESAAIAVLDRLFSATTQAAPRARGVVVAQLDAGSVPTNRSTGLNVTTNSTPR